MEQLFLSTTNLLVIGWTIACFIFYHKIFRVYYFNLARGLLKEIIGCVIAGYILTVLTLQHATPFAIGLIIVGWLITRNIDVDGVRNICFLLVLTVAIMIFFSGKKFESNLEEKSEVNNSNVAIQSDETYYAEIGVQPTAGIIETAPVELPYIPQETATSSGSDKPTVPESSQPSNGLPAATVPENTYLTGYVVESSGGLKIRNGPGTTYQEIGRLAPKEQVVIYEQVYSESYMWGRIDRGWICMDYIVMGTAPKYEETYAIGYIIGSDDGVNVRSGPAVSYDQVGKVYLGQRVVVTKLHHNGVSEWGYIGSGWICTEYIHFGEVPPEPDVYGNFDSTNPSVSEWNTDEFLFAGYDCYGRELQVGSYVCIGARQGGTEYAVGTIISLSDNGNPVVKFTEIYNNTYPEKIIYCISDLVDKINNYGYFCDEIEAQYLQVYIWG